MVRAAHQRPGLHVREAHLVARAPAVPRTRPASRSAQSADASAKAADTGPASEYPRRAPRRSRITASTSSSVSPSPSINPDFAGISGRSCLRIRQHVERPLIARAQPHLPVKPRHGFRVVIEHVRARLHHHLHRRVRRPGNPAPAPPRRSPARARGWPGWPARTTPRRRLSGRRDSRW